MEPSSANTDPAAPLSGVAVIEIGRFASAPSCATVLADLGAAVVKVEPLTGDPARGPGSLESSSAARNPRFELHNRGRRSIALDLRAERGREIMMRLVDRADVLVTNLRPDALARLGITWDDVHARNPKLVYGHITGYGLDPTAADWPSYDHGAFWSYSGVAMSFADAEGTPPQPSGGLGDRATGVSLVAGVLAALFERTRTGAGRLVSTSLLANGLWLQGSDVSDALESGDVVRSPVREHAHYPTLNVYRSRDGRWFWLQMMLPERQWTGLLAALDAPWLDDDDRFRGGSQRLLRRSNAALIEILDRIFAAEDFEHWHARFDAHGVWYAPVNTIAEAVVDPVVLGSGGIVDVATPDGRVKAVATPISFDGTPTPAAFPAPRVGEHTAEILDELGFDGRTVAELEDEMVIARQRVTTGD